jgi:hypothetical protein
MTRTYRWARRAVWGTFAVVLTIGCNPLATIAFLTHKDTPVPAKYPLVTKEGPKKDKEEITVALFVSLRTGMSFEFAGADSTIASEMARKMPELAKENKQKVKVIPTSKVNEFKFKNPTWKDMHASAWGKALGVDYVLEIHLDKLRVYQPGSSNQLYEGRAEVSVFMYDVEEGAAEPKYYVYPYSFPKTGFLDATSIPLGTFRKDFLERLAVELGQQHIDYKPGSGIAEGGNAHGH